MIHCQSTTYSENSAKICDRIRPHLLHPVETHLRRKDIQVKRPDIVFKYNLEVTFGTQVN